LSPYNPSAAPGRHRSCEAPESRQQGWGQHGRTVRLSEVCLRWSKGRPRPPQALGLVALPRLFRPPLYGRRAYGWLWRVWPYPSSSLAPLRWRDRSPRGRDRRGEKWDSNTVLLRRTCQNSNLCTRADFTTRRHFIATTRNERTYPARKPEKGYTVLVPGRSSALRSRATGIPCRATRLARAWQAVAAPLTQQA
jgi:hypothetical protein